MIFLTDSDFGDLARARVSLDHAAVGGVLGLLSHFVDRGHFVQKALGEAFKFGRGVSLSLKIIGIAAGAGVGAVGGLAIVLELIGSWSRGRIKKPHLGQSVLIAKKLGHTERGHDDQKRDERHKVFGIFFAVGHHKIVQKLCPTCKL